MKVINHFFYGIDVLYHQHMQNMIKNVQAIYTAIFFYKNKYNFKRQNE